MGCGDLFELFGLVARSARQALQATIDDRQGRSQFVGQLIDQLLLLK